MAPQQKTCKGCGLRMVLDIEECTIDHEVPECGWFKTLLAEAASKSVEPAEISIVYRDDAGRKVKAGQS